MGMKCSCLITRTCFHGACRKPTNVGTRPMTPDDDMANCDPIDHVTAKKYDNVWTCKSPQANAMVTTGGAPIAWCAQRSIESGLSLGITLLEQSVRHDIPLGPSRPKLPSLIWPLQMSICHSHATLEVGTFG